MKEKQAPRRWRDYEQEKAELAARVARVARDGQEAARLFEEGIRAICKRRGL